MLSTMALRLPVLLGGRGAVNLRPTIVSQRHGTRTPGGDLDIIGTCLSSPSSWAPEKETWPPGNHLCSRGAQRATDPAPALASSRLLLRRLWLLRSASLPSSSLFLGLPLQSPPPKIKSLFPRVPSQSLPTQPLTQLGSSAASPQPPSHPADSRFSSSITCPKSIDGIE